MNPIEVFKLIGEYNKANAIAKEKAPMITKITQYATLLVTVVGTLGVSNLATGWVEHHTVVFGVLVALAQLLHAVFPSIFSAPAAQQSNSSKVPMVLLAMCLFGLSAGAQTTEAPKPVGFTGSTDAIAFHYNGAWSAGTTITQSFDFLDLGATKSNRIYLEGKELIAPTPGLSLYMGGVAFQPDLTKALSKTNVAPGSFSATFEAAVGNGVPSVGDSHIALMVGGGVKYQISTALTWQSLNAFYGRFGSNSFAGVSTGLAYFFGK